MGSLPGPVEPASAEKSSEGVELGPQVGEHVGVPHSIGRLTGRAEDGAERLAPREHIEDQEWAQPNREGRSPQQQLPGAQSDETHPLCRECPNRHGADEPHEQDLRREAHPAQEASREQPP